MDSSAAAVGGWRTLMEGQAAVGQKNELAGLKLGKGEMAEVLRTYGGEVVGGPEWGWLDDRKGGTGGRKTLK